MFFLDLALCCRSTCQFRWNSEKSNHMLSATSNIELEFLTKFLNMSQFQNSNIDWFCCLRGCHYILPGLYAWRPCHAEKLALKHLHIIIEIEWEFKLVILHRSCVTIIFCCLGQYWGFVSCDLSSLLYSLAAVTGASPGARKRALKMHLQTNHNL